MSQQASNNPPPTPVSSGEPVRHLYWDGNESPRRNGLLYLLEIKHDGAMTPSRRPLCCRVFSIAFCDRLDHANVLGEVSWSLIKGQFRQRTRQENPIAAWIAVLNEVQTPAQLAAAQEARERIDVADRFVLNANGTCLQSERRSTTRCH